MVWEIETSKIVYKEEEKEIDGMINVEDVKSFARDNGLKTFIVEKDGEELNPEDFPIKGKIVIKEYNEGGSE